MLPGASNSGGRSECQHRCGGHARVLVGIDTLLRHSAWARLVGLQVPMRFVIGLPDSAEVGPRPDARRPRRLPGGPRHRHGDDCAHRGCGQGDGYQRDAHDGLSLVNFFPVALGPHPQRELTPMPRFGFTWPQLGMAAGAFFFTGAGAPPPARTDADAAPRLSMASARHGRGRERHAATPSSCLFYSRFSKSRLAAEDTEDAEGP